MFLALGDGSTLAFFRFANQEDAEMFGPKLPPSPFHHIALNVSQEAQAEIERRLDAHSELERWLGGDHTSNNMFR